jgi:hypothetical protein
MGSTYTLVDADAGTQISAAVIASNPYGDVSATTAAFAVTQGGVVARLKATVATIVTSDSRSPTFPRCGNAAAKRRYRPRQQIRSRLSPEISSYRGQWSVRQAP